ncbi:MAG: family 78 glycoside hydrolase catalytic domain [Verrucomicrobiota bacterium]
MATAQTAYQILVASSADGLAKDHGDLWDSGRIPSGEMSQIAYGGKALDSNEACWWKVRVWDQAGKTSAWSKPGQWTMGILHDADWSGAHWIGAPGPPGKPSLEKPAPAYETVLLRRTFTVKDGLKCAVVDVCGLGQYELSLNGGKVSDDLLTPGWTQYEKTCLYDTYDITGALRPGANAVGLFLGNGMYLLHHGRFSSNTYMTNGYAPIQAIAAIRLEYADGTVDTIVTDGQWRCASGPITFSSAYGGEDYDARLEPPGWKTPDFDDTAWSAPQLLSGPGGELKGLSCSAPPIRAFSALTPVGRKEIKPGVTVYDFGQNASVIVRLKAKGPAGSGARITPAELVHADGTVDRSSAGGGAAYWQYTLRGEGDETYFGKFFYQGARYFQVELFGPNNSDQLPEIESIEADVIHADCAPVGRFSCSNELFNQTYTLVRWAQQNNLVSIATDCPTREKRGWLEQTHLNGPALRYNWDMNALFAKTANDMKDAQRPSGLVPSTAPDYTHWENQFADSPEWGSACILLPWQQYEFAHDVVILRDSYDTMQKYQAYLQTKAKDDLVSYGLGDWFNIGDAPPVTLTATAFYYEDTVLLARIADLLGKIDDAARYRQQADEIRGAFNRALFHADTNEYGNGGQSADSIALVMGLVDPANSSAIVDNIVRDVQAKGLTAGDVGYRYLLRALADAGRSDVVYALNNQSDKPGYGYQIKLGKTALTEGWDGTQSQDHFMLGQINEWFFHDLAGIQGDPDGPGFRKIIIHPAVVGDLSWVKASYDSISGTISSEWKRDGATISLHVTIPLNTTAVIWVPAGDPKSVHLESASSASAPFLKSEDGYALYQAGPGTYDFTASLPTGLTSATN